MSEDEPDIFTATYCFSCIILTLFGLIVLVLFWFGLFIVLAQP